MERMRIEVCIVSAKGLSKSSSPWKQQWFAVGWIDPNHKYCTKIDNSGTPNPTWNTKFSATISDDSVLTVELYTRDPFFLREKLQGFASVELSELISLSRNLSADPQLATLPLKNKKKSSKPRGFVNVSVRFSDHEEIAKKNGDEQSYYYPPRDTDSGGYEKIPSPESGPRRRGTPPPPPPPENTGFIPSFFPAIGRLPEKMEHGGARGSEAAAMAAGAVIFGDDFLWAGNFRGA